jgi:hypothetical protein
MVVASCWPAATTASFAASSVGEVARLFHADQKFDSWPATLALEGSLKALCACSSTSALAVAALSELFWARYWASRYSLRTRVIVVTLTPVPSCAPRPVYDDSAGIVSGLSGSSSAVSRE